MSEKSHRIRSETFSWLQDRYEQDVLLLVNNPDSFCASDTRTEMDQEIRLYYQILTSVGQDINFTFWAVIESFLERGNSKHEERVALFKKIVLEGASNGGGKS
jgi:hypothetical protein